MFLENPLSYYELFSTLIALIAVIISFVVIVRNRKLSSKLLSLENANVKLAAISVLITEYKSEVELFEKALVDGTIERENLCRSGMERVLDELTDKQSAVVEEIEKILKLCSAQET